MSVGIIVNEILQKFDIDIHFSLTRSQNASECKAQITCK